MKAKHVNTNSTGNVRPADVTDALKYFDARYPMTLPTIENYIAKLEAAPVATPSGAQAELVAAAEALLIAIGGDESTDIFCIDMRAAIAKAKATPAPTQVDNLTRNAGTLAFAASILNQ